LHFNETKCFDNKWQKITLLKVFEKFTHTMSGIICKTPIETEDPSF